MLTLPIICSLLQKLSMVESWGAGSRSKMRIAYHGRKILLAAIAALLTAVPAMASPWAEVGDNQLRSDIALLEASGVIDNITTHWPLPWNSLVAQLQNNALTSQPAAVRAAAQRVMGHARSENRPGLSASLYLDATNQPSVVYGFDGMGRGDGSAQMILSYSSEETSARLALGGISQTFQGKTTRIMPEGTYFAQKLDNALIYGGWMSHWWGPGWISALQLSNNARPMPQIGIQRLDTSASKWPILSWLGPWQVEFLLGYMDGPRIQKDTFYNALRFTFQPVSGLEIGLSRTQQFCGEGHPCAPIRDYFSFANDMSVMNRTNDQGQIDIKYSGALGRTPFEIYIQLMNEDSSPFTRSGTSHLFGGTLFLMTADRTLRLTAEYTDSIPTVDIFSFGSVIHGFSYNNYSYLDGMRYRGRSLGFSLDSDSRLLSLQGSWSGDTGRFYQLSFHHATISHPQIASDILSFYNSVTAAPVTVNMGEARVTLPMRGFRLDLAARLQDDQPRPQRGFLASFEAAVTINF